MDLYDLAIYERVQKEIRKVAKFIAASLEIEYDDIEIDFEIQEDDGKKSFAWIQYMENTKCSCCAPNVIETCILTKEDLTIPAAFINKYRLKRNNNDLF